MICGPQVRFVLIEYILKNNLENTNQFTNKVFHSFYMLLLTPFNIQVKRYKNNKNAVSFYGY